MNVLGHSTALELVLKMPVLEILREINADVPEQFEL